MTSHDWDCPICDTRTGHPQCRFTAGTLRCAEPGCRNPHHTWTGDGLDRDAVDLARQGWQVFPLRGKIPAIPGGRGVLDATSDPAQVAAWWGGPHRNANIGARVPTGLFVLDIDPRNGGLTSLAALEDTHGRLHATLTVWSGRGDLGRHLYYRHPGGKITSRRLGDGLDIKTSAGYCVAPRSLHPDTGQPYTWETRPPVATPAWLATLIRPGDEAKPRRPTAPMDLGVGFLDSIADTYSTTVRWPDILEPHGWVRVHGDGDTDCSRWRHPTATSPVSATIKNGCLFVYSTNTPFDVTEAAAPRGYTRFRAYAVLNHGGDLSSAARTLRIGAAA
jgi:hypothetical protein